ncbi:MAG: AAA family ATPase [Candidatus Micrarchaeia archaeon]
MLKKISLFCWRSHKHTQLEFRQGSNMFLGMMGSGKSSVMDALCFALYGTYPKLSRRDVVLSDVKNFRYPKDETAVELEWVQQNAGDETGTNLGRNYRIRREVDSASAWLYCDGKLLCKGAKAVSEEVEKILQIPYELFSRAVYAEQNRLDYWLTLSAGARKAELDRILGLDKFETARSAATSEINRLKEKAAEAEKEVNEEKLALARKELAAKKQEIEQRKEEIAQVLKEKELAKKELETAQAEYAKIEMQKKEADEISKKINMLLGRKQSLEKNVQGQKDVDAIALAEQAQELAKKRWEIEAQAVKAQENGREISALIAKAQMKLRNIDEREKKKKELFEKMQKLLAGKSVQEARGELDELKKKIEGLIIAIAKMESESSDEKKVLQALGVHLSGHDGKVGSCPVCKQELDEKRRGEIENEAKKKIAMLAQEVEKSGQELGRERKIRESLERVDVECARLEAQIKAIEEVEDKTAIEQELGLHKNSLENIVGQEKIARGEIEKIAHKQEEIRSMLKLHEQVQIWRKELVECANQLSLCMEKMQKCGFDEKIYALFMTRMQDASAKKSKTQEKYEGVCRLLESIEQTFSLLEKNLREMEKKKEDATALRMQADELGTFREVVIATQAQLRENLIGEINSAMQRLWPIIYPYSDWSKVKIEAGQNDYELKIFQGEWKSLESHASGGERACLGLCMRAALSILLTPQLGWLILDEPTHNLDSQAVNLLGLAISEKLPQIIPQVIVITHEPRLVESTPSRVFKFSRDKLKGEDTNVQIDGQNG